MSLHPSPVRLVLVSIALATLVAACSDSGSGSPPATSEDFLAPGPFAVSSTSVSLIDTSRATPPAGTSPGSSTRVLPTDVYFPAQGGEPGALVPGAALDSDGGPYPLILFAHGLFGARTNFQATLVHLASHGYVVAAADFPETNFGTIVAGTANIADLINQPGDLSFLIDVLTTSPTPALEPIAAAVDGERIGVLGHSFGGATSILLAYGGSVADPRIDAVVTAAPFSCFAGAALFSGAREVPFLDLHGTSDGIVDVAWTEDLFPRLPTPRYRGDIVGGDHLGFLSDPTVPSSFRDVQAYALFSTASGSFAAQFAALSEALATRVPAADVSLCASRPIFPDPTTPRDPFIGVARQVEITDVATTAFFAAYVKDDGSARAYLADGFAAFAPDVRYRAEQ
uniref:Alpha/beta hydrolase family n=1 Tax=uncultured organism TaxID=155900 RepID=G3CRC6_9ZZZZ|nr:hypothetical protein [uncultured organism]